MKKAFLRAGYDRIANAILIGKILENRFTKYLVRTSQAIDIINGGEKANALPEDTKVLINHRIAVESTVEEVKEHFVTRVVEVAKRHNISVVAYGEYVHKSESDSGLFNVTVNSKPLDAAPVTPTNDTVWSYLAGVTRHVYEDLVFTNITYPIVTVPSMLTGNTDTRHYWNLTRNIFRFSPGFISNFLVVLVSTVLMKNCHLTVICNYKLGSMSTSKPLTLLKQIIKDSSKFFSHNYIILY